MKLKRLTIFGNFKKQKTFCYIAEFFRTSNGKSSVINAMLHSRVLPQGIGHTTKCFIQVEGSKTGEKYITTEDQPEVR